ncbi:MAG TPA: chemotaxis protein CheW [Candidatus Angelobacter sp.]|jgi:purine-binding chemotaxis protein CheW|nr:chemotaxis protein CheW [Candidatus Angelobacter sp.]
MNTEKQYCTFFVKDLLCGIEVAHVEEIVSESCVSQAPLAAGTVAGLVNRRGAIVTAIHMGRQLGLPDDDKPRSLTTIFVRSRDETLGLVVDAIGDVLSVRLQDFEPPPASLQGVAREIIIGAYKLPERLLLPLNLHKIT